MKRISSRDNPTLKHLHALLDDARYRRAEQATLLDGAHLLEAAARAGAKILRVMVTAKALQRAEIASLFQTALPPHCEVIELTEPLLRWISPVETPSGLVTEIGLPPLRAQLDTNSDVLVLEAIQEAGNLGTLLRTAAAAGVRQVFLTEGCAHAWAPKVLRAGMGAHFALSITEAADIPSLARDWPGPIIATALKETSRNLFTLDLQPPNMWLFGSEGQGLSHAALGCARQLVRIPMASEVESLNVAAAAAICLFEQQRQRVFKAAVSQ